MTVIEMIQELKKMNPGQEVVVAIDKKEGVSEYISIDYIAQSTKNVVIEITY